MFSWVRFAYLWLLETVEALPQAEGLKEFLKSSRVNSRAFFAPVVFKHTWAFLGSYGVRGGG
jgi:hypothetical protein